MAKVFPSIMVEPPDPVLYKVKADSECVAPFHMHPTLLLLPEYFFPELYPALVLPCPYCDQGTKYVEPLDFGHKPLMHIVPARLFFKRSAPSRAC